MCHLLIFESNVKSRESWFLSGKILYFLEARMCYLLKIASWSAWKAAPVWLSPVQSSCVCDMLYCLHVSPKVTCPEASSGQVYLLQYPFLLSRVLSLCWWPIMVFGPHLFGYTWDMLRHMCCVLCAVSSCVFRCAITFWVGFSLVMFANISESLRVRSHILAYGQWCTVKCGQCPVWEVHESMLFLSELSILQLRLSVLIWCLFLTPALAVRGRRLLASGISSHTDAVLSVFVSQCTRPHFLVDESRVPVCAGSNSVSFQHPTLLWDGRKSNYLPVLFFTWVLLLRIYQLPVIPR